MIRVVIADDSPTCRILLRSILKEEAGFEVVGDACDGKEASELVAKLKPDVVVMDLLMPEMDGIAATKKIMSEVPTPIVIVSSSQSIHETATAMKALSSGALSLIDKPSMALSGKCLDECLFEFTRTVRLMSSVKVIRNRQSATGDNGIARVRKSSSRFDALNNADLHTTSYNPQVEAAVNNETGNGFSRKQTGASSLTATKMPGLPEKRPSVIAIATSTGGPPALWQIVQSLPKSFPIPIVVVQHIGHGFVDGMVEWLNRGGGACVKVAAGGDRLLPGTVYIAPDGVHMGASADGRIQLSKTPPIGGFRPSATFMFESIAASFAEGSVGIIMTGMGDDGVKGLAHVKRRGGKVIAQDQATSVVFGMPSAAIRAGITDLVLPLNVIPTYIEELGRI